MSADVARLVTNFNVDFPDSKRIVVWIVLIFKTRNFLFLSIKEAQRKQDKLGRSPPKLRVQIFQTKSKEKH